MTAPATPVVEEKPVEMEKVEAPEAKSAAAKARKKVGETAEHIQHNPFAETVHKALLAGIGAGALTKDEMRKIVKRLVERGELAEADGHKMLKEAMAKRKREAKEAMKGAKKAEAEMDKRVEEILTRMNIPTKVEIEALSAKITTLTKKVDDLKKGQ